MAFGSPVRCSETKISPRNTHPPVLTRQERSFEAFDNYDESLSPSGSSALAQGLVDEDSCTVVLQNVLGYESLYKEIRIISIVARTSACQPGPGHVEHVRWTRSTIGPHAPDATPIRQANDVKTEISRYSFTALERPWLHRHVVRKAAQDCHQCQHKSHDTPSG